MPSRLKSFTSFWKAFVIQVQRATDQTWRRISGIPTNRHSEITPHLFLGGQYARWGLDKLKRRGITAIVSMRTRQPTANWGAVGIKFLHLPTVDQQAPSMAHLKKGAAFIDKEIQAGGKVYIHCLQGEGRGPTMVIAYLMSQGLTYEDAFEQVRKVRGFIRPSAVQVKRLKEFEQLFTVN